MGHVQEETSGVVVDQERVVFVGILEEGEADAAVGTQVGVGGRDASNQSGAGEVFRDTDLKGSPF